MFVFSSLLSSESVSNLVLLYFLNILKIFLFSFVSVFVDDHSEIHYRIGHRHFRLIVNHLHFQIVRFHQSQSILFLATCVNVKNGTFSVQIFRDVNSIICNLDTLRGKHLNKRDTDEYPIYFSTAMIGSKWRVAITTSE